MHSYLPKFSLEFTNSFNSKYGQLLYVVDDHSQIFPFYNHEISNVRDMLQQKLKIKITEEQVTNFCNDDLSKYFLQENSKEFKGFIRNKTPLEIYNYITSKKEYDYNYKTFMKFKNNSNAKTYLKNQVVIIGEFIKDTQDKLLIKDIHALTNRIQEIEEEKENFYYLYFEHEREQFKNNYVINHIHYDVLRSEYTLCNLIFSSNDNNEICEMLKID